MGCFICNLPQCRVSKGRQPFAEGFSPTVALPIGNSELDSIGIFMFLTGLETDCRQETGASRLSPY
ncbi:MAG: hypothetical protein LBG58_13760 [Planctomycetaceae bacterium]|nr:hypothetical protein [Planctomycetaceae bacterium]